MKLEQIKNKIGDVRREITRARRMRSDLSEPEVILWSRLKLLRARGFHFRRQAPFRGYFLDFVCNTRRIVIEVDGAQHGVDTQAEHDAVRDAVLQKHGFRTLRFWASDVRLDADWVMDQIIATLEAAPSTRPSAGTEPEADLPTLTASRSVPPH